MEGHTLFPWEVIGLTEKIYWQHAKKNFSESYYQFQPNLAQSILGYWRLKIIQISDHHFLRMEIMIFLYCFHQCACIIVALLKLVCLVCSDCFSGEHCGPEAICYIFVLHSDGFFLVLTNPATKLRNLGISGLKLLSVPVLANNYYLSLYAFNVFSLSVHC